MWNAWFGQMSSYGMMGYGSNFGFGAWGPLMLLLVLWSFVWKGLALWHSGRRNQPWWFVAFLIINTAGILEIVYLFGFAKLKAKELFSGKR